MIKLQKNWPYLLLIIIAIVLIALGWYYPKIDQRLNWIITCLTLLLVASGFIHSVLAKEQEKTTNRPNLTGWITKIAEVAQGTPPKVTYFTVVQNIGDQDTEIVDAFLILEGQKRDNAISLGVFPQGIVSDGKKIAARSQRPFLLQDRGHKIADYCNPKKGTIFLRDATDREYPIRVGKIARGARGRRISDFPVRED